MAWLRIDDTAMINSKLGRLTDREFRSLVALWSYCARSRNGGEFAFDEVGMFVYVTAKGPFTTTPSELRRFVELGLIDTEDGETFRIHDWHAYQPSDPTAAERMRKQREKQGRPDPKMWKETRALVLERDRAICTDCGKDCSEPSDDGRDLWNADHEPPRSVLIAEGKSIYDLAYIVTRCHSCHSKKTRRQANERKRQTEPGANH